jgi:hypothetical protein
MAAGRVSAAVEGLSRGGDAPWVVGGRAWRDGARPSTRRFAPRGASAASPRPPRPARSGNELCCYFKSRRWALGLRGSSVSWTPHLERNLTYHTLAESTGYFVLRADVN